MMTGAVLLVQQNPVPEIIAQLALNSIKIIYTKQKLMSKTKDGKFVPPKGKPSGNGRDNQGLKQAFGAADPDRYQQIASSYTNDDEDIAANVRVRHVNRTVHKGEDELNNP